MPTLQEWMDVRPDYGESKVVRRLFELRPEWLAKGDIPRRVLCRFDPPTGGHPLVLRWDEVTLEWGEFDGNIFHQDFDEPPERAAEYAIEWIEDIRAARLVLFTWANSAGGRTFDLIPPARVSERVESMERCGYPWYVQAWLSAPLQ